MSSNKLLIIFAVIDIIIILSAMVYVIITKSTISWFSIAYSIILFVELVILIKIK